MQRIVRVIAAGAAACALTLGTAAQAPGSLTAGAQLASIYDTILDARFDDARAQLDRTCPPAPRPACDVLRTVALWWQIQQDPGQRLHDRAFEGSAAAAIESTRAWTAREPQRAEAWFYLAGAYAPLSQWRVLRGERLAAARNGKTIKDALERALALDARLDDAWFGIGLYHYYADVAPAALKFLRFLLLLPGGDRREGLREMLRARDQGELLRGEADYQLHWVYVWYEEQPAPALALLRALERRYPHNPVFLQRIAEMLHENFSDHQGSVEAWERLADRATRGTVHAPSMTLTRARVGLAAEVLDTGAARRAVSLLSEIDRAQPSEPYGIAARASLLLGDAYARLGDVEPARAAYRRAIARAPMGDPDRVIEKARVGLGRH